MSNATSPDRISATGRRTLSSAAGRRPTLLEGVTLTDSCDDDIVLELEESSDNCSLFSFSLDGDLEEGLQVLNAEGTPSLEELDDVGNLTVQEGNRDTHDCVADPTLNIDIFNIRSPVEEQDEGSVSLPSNVSIPSTVSQATQPAKHVGYTRGKRQSRKPPGLPTTETGQQNRSAGVVPLDELDDTVSSHVPSDSPPDQEQPTSDNFPQLNEGVVKAALTRLREKRRNRGVAKSPPARSNFKRLVKYIPNKRSKKDDLMYSLAQVAHCHSTDEAAIFRKATWTISVLHRHAYNQMVAHSELKQQNETLKKQNNRLRKEIGASGCHIPLEVPLSDVKLHRPSVNAAGRCDGNASSGGILSGEMESSAPDTGTDTIRVDFLEDVYEEVYNAPFRSPPLEAILCGNNFCRLGCVCDSLFFQKKRATQHCRHPVCMLESECISPGDESHLFIPSRSISSGNVSLSSNRDPLVSERLSDIQIASILALRSASYPSSKQRSLRRLFSTRIKKQRAKRGTRSNQVLRRAPYRIFADPKLKQRCAVHLTKLAPEILKTHLPSARMTDSKLDSEKCYVPLKRLTVNPDLKIYCMEHSIHYCPCLTDSAAHCCSY